MHELAAAILADFRSLRARAWVWVLWVFVPCAGIAVFVAHSTAHYARSRLSPTGYVDPRYMIEGIGAIPLWLACAGVVFLALDLDRIDHRDRVPQAVYARPPANVQLVLGRVCALAGSAWISLLILAIGLQATGIASQLLDWPMGGPVGSAALTGFLIVESMPAIILFTGLVLLLTTTGSRALALAPLVALAVQIYVLFHAPAYLRPAVSIVGTLGGTASDFFPELASRDEIFRGVCSILIGAGLCVVAAAVHPRLDTAHPIRTLAAGLALVLAGVVGIGYLANRDAHAIAVRDAWAEAHGSVSDQPRADVERISAHVAVDAGERLTVEAALHLVLPARRPTTDLVLSLNPGMRIEEVQLNDRTASFRHELGLLTVMLEEKVGFEDATLFVRSSGVPDPRFAYLDSVEDGQRASLADSHLHLLGTEASIFSTRYVALMPGVRWIPFPGPNYQTSIIAKQPVRDFFDLDLEVAVPSDWIAVGPGPPVEIDRQGRTHTYRFRPAVALTDFGIFASPLLERKSVSVNDSTFELFLNPEHQRNLDYIGPSVVEHYFDTLEPETLDSLADVFLPYGGLSIVEVPSTLRVYGGGWRLDSVLGLPGIVLLREHGLPTAKLASPWGDDDIFRTLYLGDYLDRDYSGGNLVASISRHLLYFRTSPIGDESIALDLLLELLAAKVFEQSCSCTFGGDRRIFSAHRFHSPSLRQPMFSALMARAMGNTSEIRAELERPVKSIASAWDIVERLPVSQIVTAVGPDDAIGALELKMRKMAELIIDTWGRQKLTSFLHILTNEYGGGSFSASELEAVAARLDAPLQSLVGNWLDGTTLPGFLVSPINVSRLSDGVQGKPLYQATVHVRNGELTPGHVKLIWHAHPDEYGEVGPFRVEGNTSVEIGFISVSPPKWVSLNPYLSLNRDKLRIETNQRGPIDTTEAKPFTGVRNSDWFPPQDGIVVDDLDPGFRIVRASPNGHGVDLSRRSKPNGIDFDGGVPIYPLCCGMEEGTWQRDYEPWAWGKYRRTYVRASHGHGEEMAVFTVELPNAGAWRLDYHLPGRYDWRKPEQALRHDDLGLFTIVLSSSGKDVEIAFDGSEAHQGWNDLGVYDLAAGTAQVRVSSTTDQLLAISDAVRFRLVYR